MNFRGYAAYTSYINTTENTNLLVDSDEDDDQSNFYNTNNSEEENQSSNTYEVLEKLNLQIRYTFNVLDDELNNVKVETFVLDLYSLLKPSLSTPPPEIA